MNKTQLRNELDASLSELYDLFSAVSEEQVNTMPFPGSWTPGQLARHLILSNSGFLQDITGPVQDTTRPYDERVDVIRTAFLNFTTQMRSPDIVRPPAMDYNKDRLLASFQKIKEGILTAVDTLDLTQTGTSFAAPKLGYLTRWEALHFVLYHTQRHIRQLKNMMEALEKKELGIRD
jgi:hypothetical protein